MKLYLKTCESSGDSAEPKHSHSLIRVVDVCLKKVLILGSANVIFRLKASS